MLKFRPCTAILFAFLLMPMSGAFAHESRPECTDNLILPGETYEKSLERRLAEQIALNELYEAEVAELTAKLAESELARYALEVGQDSKPGKFKPNVEIVNLEPWDGIREIEETEGVVWTVRDLFPKTIVFSEEAMRGVRKLNFDRNDILLQVLVGLATDLHNLVFLEKDPEYIRGFKLRRNFEIGNENGATKGDHNIARERTVEVDGESFQGWQHVKFGVREPNMLRVYFALDHKKKRVVVTHIATHLKTAGSYRGDH